MDISRMNRMSFRLGLHLGLGTCDSVNSTQDALAPIKSILFYCTIYVNILRVSLFFLLSEKVGSRLIEPPSTSQASYTHFSLRFSFQSYSRVICLSWYRSHKIDCLPAASKRTQNGKWHSFKWKIHVLVLLHFDDPMGFYVFWLRMIPI